MAAQPAFNAALTRIGFDADADAVAAINANQITTSEIFLPSHAKYFVISTTACVRSVAGY